MKKKRLITWSLALSMLAGSAQAAGVQVSGTTIHLLFTDNQATAEVNGSAVQLDVPAQKVKNSFFVPIRWVGEQLGFPVTWNSERRSVGLTAPKAYVEWELDRGIASVNGTESPLPETAVLADGTLLVKLDWIAPYMNATCVYDSNRSRVELIYVQPTDRAYRESHYPGDTQPNSRPIAIFATDKAVYRIGEPVAYIDLSYDPDSEGLPKYEWTGNKEAFFEPGTYPVSLRIADPHSEWSETFTHEVTVIDEVLHTKSEYPWYAKPVGSFVKDESADWKRQLAEARQLPAIVTIPEERKLVISGNAPHTIDRTGIVYQERVNGKARIVLHHVNGMAQPVRFAAVVQNPDTLKKLTVRVTRTGVMQPTLLHRYNAREATVDFLTKAAADEQLEIKPGETVTLEQYTLSDGQGFASISDIETDGPANVGFIAAKPNEPLPPLPAAGKTEQGQAQGQKSDSAYSAVRMDADADAQHLTGLSQWSFGEQSDFGAGMTYSLHLYHPRQAALALLVKDGVADGTLKVNGTVVPLPQGGITDQDGAFLFYRATGLEASVDIEWMPAPGSKQPVQWLLYPLEQKK
ncbi:copper amine oxidase N-terminal domain-containing protein [Paenibacillus allorhizosphaerae]|uniref:Copper amine oxidase-like N-terminal domain-containing protein n=1 Tax=Paenibacillus allorhizosphaerae TaxID=2849866 RepID=A0ABM8VBD9_9BACL|nr:copper amine oxidase N-terminal domain-containing protein [Paenibacillus allorhizosphaerae]CAG7619311.1 hypothetical protein PAECIP111802_00607 [Paenibacillus allorhizosphaerae]